MLAVTAKIYLGVFNREYKQLTGEKPTAASIARVAPPATGTAVIQKIPPLTQRRDTLAPAPTGSGRDCEAAASVGSISSDLGTQRAAETWTMEPTKKRKVFFWYLGICAAVVAGVFFVASFLLCSS